MVYHDRLESEEQFWQALDDCLTKRCRTHELIDHTLRSWLYLVAAVRDALLPTEDDVASCAHKLMGSLVYSDNADYVRRHLIKNLLHDDESAPLHVILWFLLLDGRLNADTFKLMIAESCFPRLAELIFRHGRGRGDARLHHIMLEVMFEMSRIERLRREDMEKIDDAFVAHLLQSIESVSDDARVNPTIRVLLVLNEQYMVESTVAAAAAEKAAADGTPPSEVLPPLTNRVIKLLSLEGSNYRNFGENIILVLNREVETSYQLLILKALYLLFTNKATHEYFYTNDLKVLVDIILRNLMDLPEDKDSLRHTYLRVLYPLLAHTQLSQPHAHYKKHDILAVLNLITGQAGRFNSHFAPTDETTLRLSERVRNVEWLVDNVPQPTPQDLPPPATLDIPDSASIGSGSGEDSPSEESPTGTTPAESTGRPRAISKTKKEKELAARLLGMSLHPTQTDSSMSVGDVAAVTEKPGVTTPSRVAEFGANPGDMPNIDGVVAGELPVDLVPSRTGSTVVTDDGSSAFGTPPPGSCERVKPAVPAPRGKKPLPQVPKHRHGNLLAASQHASTASTVSVTSSISSVGSATSEVKKSLTGKRVPPQAPPPRRTTAKVLVGENS